MPTHFRLTKLQRFIKRLEAKIPVVSPERAEALKEVVADLKHEFKLKEGEKE